MEACSMDFKDSQEKELRNRKTFRYSFKRKSKYDICWQNRQRSSRFRTSL